MSSAKNSVSSFWRTNNRLRGTHWALSPELGEGQKSHWGRFLKPWSPKPYSARLRWTQSHTPFFLQFEAIFALFLCQKPCLQNPFCCPFSFSLSFFDSFFFALLGVLGLLVVIVLVLVFLFFFFFLFFFCFFLLLFLFFSPLSFFHLLSLVIVLCQSLLGCFSSFRFQVCIFWPPPNLGFLFGVPVWMSDERQGCCILQIRLGFLSQ